jgi:hypothetical protein
MICFLERDISSDALVGGNRAARPTGMPSGQARQSYDRMSFSPATTRTAARSQRSRMFSVKAVGFIVSGATPAGP